MSRFTNLALVTTAFCAVVSIAVLAQAPAAGRQGGGRGQVQLPDGAGKELVSATCGRCHGLNLIIGSFGYTKDGWENRMSTMIALAPDARTTISTYLGANFPPKPSPSAVMIAGPASANIREWLVPTLGSRPHDPLAAADGSIWWTGQFQHRLGRLDPATGVMREFPVPDGSQPHGLVEDRQGNIWYTGIMKSVIGRLDPKTGQVREYPLNEPGARGPHTPIFDQKGMLFFTLQSGHVGRLNPANGEMLIVKTPSDNTYPYGIQINSQGVAWYVDFRGNRVGSVNPLTMEIKEYTLPNAEARPRRIAITPDDVVWYTDFARGYLGRFDPKTGQTKEWPSPSGADSEPYGIVAVGNTLWYSESGVRPNTMVRFDPQTEKFQTWAVPSGGGVLRNMMTTRNGNIVIASSGVNRVGIVEISSNTSPGGRTN